MTDGSPSSESQKDPPLSKNALKRQLKRQRWEESREERRAIKRAKIKQKKEKMKLNGQAQTKRRKPSLKDQEQSGIRVVLDCSFDNLMNEKEVTSMSSQLTRCHAENRRSLKPVQIFITSLNGRLGSRMETAMRGVHRQWRGVSVSEENYLEALSDISLENFVYLTADSDNVIHSLQADKVYIIGGLVDKNRHKCLCYNKALKQGIQHGRLPIEDYIKMAARHVLTVNQVLEIILRWLECRDWEKAFMDVIPKRKLPQLYTQGEVNPKDVEYCDDNTSDPGESDGETEEPESLEIRAVTMGDVNEGNIGSDGGIGSGDPMMIR